MTWAELQNALDGGAEGTVIEVGQDLFADGQDRILVEGKKVTIDLNGHKLDRQLTSSDSDGHVIEVTDGSDLTIKDSIGTGIITGGYAKNGGGINIDSESICTITGGTITGNR